MPTIIGRLANLGEPKGSDSGSVYVYMRERAVTIIKAETLVE